MSAIWIYHNKVKVKEKGLERKKSFNNLTSSWNLQGSSSNADSLKW